MKRVLHCLLVWLMVIAMPVQGMAASMMLSCGPGHAQRVQGTVDTAAAAHAHAHAHAGEHAPRHEAGHAAHVHAHIPASDEATPAVTGPAGPGVGEASSAHHGKFSCSACAACCIMLAPPASFSLPPDPGPVSRVQTAASAPTPSHEPDRLDRPPRARHA